MKTVLRTTPHETRQWSAMAAQETLRRENNAGVRRASGGKESDRARARGARSERTTAMAKKARTVRLRVIANQRSLKTLRDHCHPGEESDILRLTLRREK